MTQIVICMYVAWRRFSMSSLDRPLMGSHGYTRELINPPFLPIVGDSQQVLHRTTSSVLPLTTTLSTTLQGVLKDRLRTWIVPVTWPKKKDHLKLFVCCFSFILFCLFSSFLFGGGRGRVDILYTRCWMHRCRFSDTSSRVLRTLEPMVNRVYKHVSNDITIIHHLSSSFCCWK